MKLILLATLRLSILPSLLFTSPAAGAPATLASMFLRGPSAKFIHSDEQGANGFLNAPAHRHLVSYDWQQVGLAIDGEADRDYSGFSVSLSDDGKTVAIGAHRHDGTNGTHSGYVRVFRYDDSLTTTSRPVWTQLGEEIDGESASDESGSSVSLSGDGTTLAVGAQMNDGGGSNSGQVRVYEYDGIGWMKLGEDIDGEAAGDLSGCSVSLSTNGRIVAIGAKENDGVNGEKSGHVRVYEYFDMGIGWLQMGEDIDGESARDESGYSVSLSADGKRVAIGAPKNDGRAPNSGHVRVHEFDGSRWNQLGQDIDGGSYGDRSGWSVSLAADGERVAIGAPYNDGFGQVRVYEYNQSRSRWKKLGNDIDGEERFGLSGYSVSLSSDGKTVAVGATNTNKKGDVRVYEYVESDGSWEKLGQYIEGETMYENFGYSVSLSADGEKVAVGGPSWSYFPGGPNAGRVRIFEFALPQPTAQPTPEPTSNPTAMPPTKPPTSEPTPEPSSDPTAMPPTTPPTSEPTPEPTSNPTALSWPTTPPTSEPTPEPTSNPTALSWPTTPPTSEPTREPTSNPTALSFPTTSPTSEPTREPTSNPTALSWPTTPPTSEPTPDPTSNPTAQLWPTTPPTPEPTPEPTEPPTSEPTPEPTSEPTPEPTSEPTPEPTSSPTALPWPTSDPTSEPEWERPTAPTPIHPPTSEPTPEPSSQGRRTVMVAASVNDNNKRGSSSSRPSLRRKQ